MPSFCGMFVCKGMMSAVTKRALDGRGGSFQEGWENVLSLMCDGRFLARGWVKCVM